MSDSLSKQYHAAIRDCDDAWDGFEGASKSGFKILAAEEHAAFRNAYGRKCFLHAKIRAEEGVK